MAAETARVSTSCGSGMGNARCCATLRQTGTGHTGTILPVDRRAPLGAPGRQLSTACGYRRIRRWSAAVMVASGALSLLAATTLPLHQRLNAIHDVFPLA